ALRARCIIGCGVSGAIPTHDSRTLLRSPPVEEYHQLHGVLVRDLANNGVEFRYVFIIENYFIRHAQVFLPARLARGRKASAPPASPARCLPARRCLTLRP